MLDPHSKHLVVKVVRFVFFAENRHGSGTFFITKVEHKVMLVRMSYLSKSSCKGVVRLALYRRLDGYRMGQRTFLHQGAPRNFAPKKTSRHNVDPHESSKINTCRKQKRIQYPK